MNGLEDLLELLAVERRERKRYQLLESLGYSDPSDDDFGLNKWTRLLSLERSDEEYQLQEFREHEPDHLVSVVAIPHNFSELELDVGSQTFREWLSSLKWEYCPVSEAPFPNAQPQACSEGILLPTWLNTEWRTVLERYLLIQRNGVAELGLGDDVCYGQNEEIVFSFIPIVARIWQFLGFYNDLSGEFLENQITGISYLVNIRGTRNALLGNLAEGWKEPHQRFPRSYAPRCPDKHLQFSRVTDPTSPGGDVESLVRWFATRIDNAWGQFEPRCYVHVNRDESQPFASRGPGR